MVQQLSLPNQPEINQTEINQPEIIYPERDGNPMSDNTKQFDLIVKIKENLEILFANNPRVFVAGDLLWYPVEKNNLIRQAPDIMVAFGRPKGYRGSYRQWQEDGIAPQVVFEILSPGNTLKEMAKKLEFYNDYGVAEYYLYDPNKNDLNGWIRSQGHLVVIDTINGWVSPHLEIRFELTEDNLEIYRPDGQRFLSPVELAQLAEQTQQQLEQERQRTEQTQQQLEQAQAQIRRLQEQLQSLGVDLESLNLD